MDTIFPLMFGAVFLLIVGVMILALVRSASEWSSNNSSPVLSVDARVVSKRTNITRHMSQADSSHMTRSSTVYYATFQVESGGPDGAADVRPGVRAFSGGGTGASSPSREPATAVLSAAWFKRRKVLFHRLCQGEILC